MTLTSERRSVMKRLRSGWFWLRMVAAGMIASIYCGYELMRRDGESMRNLFTAGYGWWLLGSFLIGAAAVLALYAWRSRESTDTLRMFRRDHE